MPKEGGFKPYFGGGGGGGGQGGGSNQYFSNLPSLPQIGSSGGGGTPGVVSGASPTVFSPTTGAGEQKGGLQKLGKGFFGLPTHSPDFTSDFLGFLKSQVGQGATPFSGEALLPSSGEGSGAGQLTAPMNEILSSLMEFYKTGDTDLPGFETLQQLSETGLPVSQTPAWEAMVEAMQRQIGESRSNLRESFAFGGNLASSPFGRATADFETQTTRDLNAQLLMAETQAMEAARGRQAGASKFLGGVGGELSSFLQGMDQDSINRMLAEFIRTRPEYSPLINAQFAGSTSSPGVVSKKFGLGGIGGLLAGGGNLLGGLADILGSGGGDQ